MLFHEQRTQAPASLFPDAERPAERDERRAPDAPLADRMRPRTLDEILGQDEVLGPGKPLAPRHRAGPAPLAHPVGTARLGQDHAGPRHARRTTRAHFESMSAVLSGVKELREILKDAEERRKREARRTIVFIDEIHRFNKAQQDALLSHVESGDVVLIGATTENPSFEVNAALLSRSRVVVLKPLDEQHVLAILRRASGDAERGLAAMRPEVADDALAFLARASDGDARTALNVLELAVTTARPRARTARRRVDSAAMQQAFARKALLYDRAGEEHFNLISALHKSIRNSDADAGLYWLARMLEAGRGPALHRPAPRALRLRGRGPRRPPGPRPGHGRAAGRALHRHARGRSRPGRARRLPLRARPRATPSTSPTARRSPTR